MPWDLSIWDCKSSQPVLLSSPVLSLLDQRCRNAASRSAASWVAANASQTGTKRKDNLQMRGFNVTFITTGRMGRPSMAAPSLSAQYSQRSSRCSRIQSVMCVADQCTKEATHARSCCTHRLGIDLLAEWWRVLQIVGRCRDNELSHLMQALIESTCLQHAKAIEEVRLLLDRSSCMPAAIVRVDLRCGGTLHH